MLCKKSINNAIKLSLLSQRAEIIPKGKIDSLNADIHNPMWKWIMRLDRCRHVLALLFSKGYISSRQCISHHQSHTLKFQITFKKYTICNIHFIFFLKINPPKSEQEYYSKTKLSFRENIKYKSYNNIYICIVPMSVNASHQLYIICSVLGTGNVEQHLKPKSLDLQTPISVTPSRRVEE